MKEAARQDVLGCTVTATTLLANGDDPSASRAELAARLRQYLDTTLRGLMGGNGTVHHPGRPSESLPRGSGHFHLAPELFIQISGWTRFRFPHCERLLQAGEILLIPPQLLHSEQVGAGPDGQPFENLVVYAEEGAFRCHLACEVTAGVPGMRFLDMGPHNQATRIQAWLLAAAQAVEPPVQDAERRNPWTTMQANALVAAALSALLVALEAHPASDATEPMLVSRVRVMAQNQLGDATLTVRRLAEQAGCTPDYLSNLFSVTTGEHLSAYINRLRLERAARLLQENRQAGKEIAWACGFSSHSYFIRAFRAHFGQTPKAWRTAKA